MKRPPPLRDGDLVAVVAPSSPFDDARYARGAEWLARRHRLRVRADVHDKRGYLAGDDQRRTEELQEVLADPEVRAIVAARGGYGATRFVHRLDWSRLAADPKWIVGFSDVTALHVEATRAGVASLHAPMLAWLGDASDDARTEWRAVLGGAPPGPWTGLETVVAGDAEGPVFGGNLALLETCAAAGRLVVPEGAVVFLEDCTERPYRLDRMLTALLVSGHLARAAAIVLGGFTDCHPGPDGVTADEVVRERVSTLGVPVIAGAPFGHGAENRPFVVGGVARVVGTSIEFG